MRIDEQCRRTDFDDEQLSFLILVGTALVAEGFDFHVPKGYIYFSMAFSVAVEMLNIRMRAKRRREPVHLHKQLHR